MTEKMPGMTPERIAEICGGSYTGNEEAARIEITGAVLDSRRVEPGMLFLAAGGERVDGHSFIPAAYEKGALCVLGEKAPEDTKKPYIRVEDTFAALKKMAEYYRERLDITVVGITGSVGKTSTKECIASVLAQKYKVLKTEGNFNNEIGLPLTVLRLKKEHEVAVLEMGISDFGEMHRLSQIAKPDLCVLTNIGQCHLENLGDRAGILKAKSEIFDFLRENGTVIVNGDDDMLATIGEVKGKRPIRFGKGVQNDVYADRIAEKGLLGSRGLFHTGAGEFAAEIPLPGVHMVYNALAATAVGECLGLSFEQIQKGLQSVRAIGGRGRILEAGGLTVIDDCYNANPVSMKAALDLLATATGHRTAILGDMFELGDGEAALHAQIGAYAAKKGIERLCFIGKLAEHMYREALTVREECPVPNGTIEYYADREAFLSSFTEKPLQNTTVLVKASHGMQFEKIVEVLETGQK